MKRSKSLASCFAVLALTGAANCGNLLFNSSFELGDKGWTGLRFTTLNTDGTSDYAGPAGVPDDSEAKFGERSIRLQNYGASRNASFSSHDFLVEPGKTYTVSFWGKASAENIELSLGASSRQTEFRRGADGKALPDISHEKTRHSPVVDNVKLQSSFKLSTAWSRHSVKFTPDARHSAYSIYFGLKAPGSVWLDGIQIEDGELTDYSPAASIEAAIYTASLLEAPDVLNGEFVAISYHAEKDSLSTVLQLYDIHYDKALASQSVRLALPLGKAVRKNFTFDISRFGYFCIFSGLQPRTTQTGFSSNVRFAEAPPFQKLDVNDKSFQSCAFFAAVPKPPSNNGKGFQMGMSGTTDSTDGYGSMWGTTKPFTVDNYGPPDNLMKIIKEGGSSVYRCWCVSLLPWQEIEPEKGKFVWDGTDKRVALAEKAGVPLMAVIGNDFSVSSSYDRLPDWLKKRDRNGKPEGTVYVTPPWTQTGPRIILPQLEDWRKYVSSIASRYKGRIAYYEITNEPNLWITPEFYIEYLQAAAEEIRKADPKAKIQGLSSTSDRGADLNSFLGKCIALGASKWMDIITIHPYCSSDASTPSQMAKIRDNLGDLKKLNKNTGLWNGENFYLWPSWQVWDGERLIRDFPADAVVRNYLVEMGEGLTGSTPCYIPSFFDVKCKPYQYVSHWIGLNTPNAKFAAHAGVAHFLAGAEPLKTVELPGEVLAYVFKNDKRLYSGLWAIRGNVNIRINAPKDASISSYDMFANPVEKNENSVSLALAQQPFFLEWHGTDAAKVARSIEEASIRGIDADFKLNRCIAIEDSADFKILAGVSNLSGERLKNGTVKIESPALKDGMVKVNIQDFKPMESKIFELPSSAMKQPSNTIEAELSISGSERPLKCPISIPVMKTYSLREGVWTPSLAISKTVIGSPSSPEDFSASLSLCFEKNTLLVHVNVKDDKRGSLVEGHPFESDCIELFLDRKPFDGESNSYGSETHQILYPVHSGRDGELMELANRITAVTTNSPDGYEVKFKIPLWIGGHLETLIGFDVAIDDSDANRRKNQIVWSGSAENYKNRSGFKLLKIVTPKARVDIRNGNGKKPRHDIDDPAGPDWTPHSFSYTPEQGGMVELQLLSGWSLDPRERSWIYYRKIRVEGAVLQNGDFSKLDSNGKPAGWTMGKGASFGQNEGFNFVKSTHDRYCGSMMRVEAGKTVTVSYEAYADDPPQHVE